jgi:two-component system, OmpR family, phosphate regulon sensor histidine kinase PhoR
LRQLWGRPLATVILFCCLAFLSWPVLGGAGALLLLSVLLLALLLHHIRNLSELYRWLNEPGIENVPSGDGVWGDVFYQVLRLMKRQQRSEARLSFALQRFQLAGAALPEAVVLLDENDAIEWCNPKAAQYFSLDLQRDRGQQITYFVRHPQFVRYLAEPRPSEPLTLHVAVGHSDYTLSIQLVPYGDRQRLLLGRDVTRWEKLEVTRRDFVANVSHELRTPLTVVRGFLETLEDMQQPDPEMTRRSLRLMAEQAMRMTHLVEDLLTLSRLESTQTLLREEDVNVPEMLKSLTQDANALSAGRHRVWTNIACNDWLKGSSDELHSAFGNLVSNAIRYTPEGGEIELRWEHVDGQLVFAVRDTGIGIEPQHIERLTERFYRVDKSRSRETGGTGLGLAIVKHVLNRHQARLEISSDPGRGSTFSAVFPDTRRLAPRATQPRPADAPAERLKA